jgi:uncharacterized Ntn-hydrolase superfamily protein
LSDITFEQIIDAFKDDGTLAEKAILALNVGMWEEWDCDLLRGILLLGFGAAELRIAAKAIPNDIDWSDYEANSRAVEVPDVENRHVVRILLHTKNSGPLKDMEYHEVQDMLVKEVAHQTRQLPREHWVLEVEVQ